ncbi:nuclease-related domain-containing protein [Streptomyces sp. NPDC048288]|uniref:nuclease-related domain-containing protein n=1 Tax=Streptomyces sp. NPDC048288 TaxID=3365529 RepID=UPI003711E7A3
MNAGQSPLEWAARRQKKARKGVRRKVLAWVGLNAEAARADRLAVRAAHGAVGEQWTAALLARLPAGWRVWHGLRIPGFRHDLDHVLVSPCGTAVVVLDSKRWHAGWRTRLVDGRVWCGEEDRHEKVEAVGKYAARLHKALALPGVVVWPLLVVHGSPIEGGRLEVRVPAWSGTVHVLGPDWLVPTLATAPKVLDPARAAAVAARVAQVLVPAGG